MTSAADENDFAPALGCLLVPAMDELATQLPRIPELSPSECAVVLAQTHESLCAFLHGKLARLLLLELNAARVTGRLKAEDESKRWAEFLEIASHRRFWEELTEHYPSLMGRIDRIVRNRCMASFLFAKRWAADRDSLGSLCGGPTGELENLSFGVGDSHRGGFTVALLRCRAGRIVYKPRSMRVDVVLQRFVAELAGDHDGPLNIGIPRVIDCQDYGWAEFIEHRYANGDAELAGFYRGIGHCLAIMHLLGASDLHAENLIAHGATPVIVDCETLFTPKIPPPPSGFGQALDYASEFLAGTVVNIGLLPGRAQGLGWRGVDFSGIGSLPGQQPMLPQPAIVNAGTDEAHLGTKMMPVPVTQNHPSAEPALALFWPEAVDAFAKMTATLRRLDAAGVLEQRLRAFAECHIRVVLRDTEAYSETARMLWHPVSLHNEEQARQRAYDLFAKMAANAASAPNDPGVIKAEVEDLLAGDIPFFGTVAQHGQLEGPSGSRWLEPKDLVDSSLQHWRAADVGFELNVIRAAMVSAYLNDGWIHTNSLVPQSVCLDDLDVRRRAQAARIVRGLVNNAIIGKDGSVAWIAPVLNPTGWSVQPLGMDLYAGLSGVALLTGAYVHEMRSGRADPVAGIEELFDATRYTLRLTESKIEQAYSSNIKARPPTIGAYIGLGAQLWTLLILARWTDNHDDEMRRAIVLAEGMLDAAKADDTYDMLTGRAGAISALLALAVKAGNERLLHIASELGNQLCELAQRKDGRAFWTHEQLWPQGIGGFAHGATGIGWSLTRLGRISGDPRYAQMAEAAFAFEDDLFDADEQNWLDLRALRGTKSVGAWCHGSVGIGLAHVDLDPHLRAPRTRPLLRRAVAATSRLGMGWNHCLCHGDLGSWELLDKAIAVGEAPDGMTRDGLLAQILTSIEEHGPTCGLTREVFVPGLLPGVGGVAYQLLRAHPDSTLPSVLIPGSEGI